VAYALVASCALPAEAADGAATCLFEIQLTTITSARTNDEHIGDSADPTGEYEVRVLSGRALGPFELRTGESSAFAPGLTLDVVDSGWPLPPRGQSTVATAAFAILVEEDDSTPVGEDDRDDASAPLLIREHVVCPGGRTTILRVVDVPHRSGDQRRYRPDQLRLGFQIVALD
jgi:hypothetical protein